jgi:hypothetical protein
MKKQLACKMCHTPVRVCVSKIYMRCMCDEDVRIIKYNPFDMEFVYNNLYVLQTEGNKLCRDGNLPVE